MTVTVPKGHKLLSEVCQAVIDADPATKQLWEEANRARQENNAILKRPDAAVDITIEPSIWNEAIAEELAAEQRQFALKEAAERKCSRCASIRLANSFEGRR
jgi:hypothetical protein